MAFLKPLILLVFSFTISFAETPEQELIVRVFKLLSINNTPVSVYEHNPFPCFSKWTKYRFPIFLIRPIWNFQLDISFFK